MAEFITAFRVLAGKIESTPGTAETLADADFNVRVWEPTVGTLDVPMDMDPSKYSTGDFGLGEAIPGPTSAQVTFNCKAVNASGYTTEPNWIKFMKGCGVSGVTYSGGATDQGIALFPSKYLAESSMTLGVYELERGQSPSGIHFEFAGAMGNATISVEGTGKPYMVNYEFTGALNDVDDIAEDDIPALTSPQTDIPDRFLNGSGTIDGTSVCISTIEFNIGNTISPVQCVGAQSGYEKFAITSQDPTITINPVLTRTTTFDFWDKFSNGTIQELWIETSQFKLHIPRAQITAASMEDDEGIVRTSLTYRALRPSTAGDYNYASWILYTKNFE
jgi:hypothetical protein